MYAYVRTRSALPLAHHCYRRHPAVLYPLTQTLRDTGCCVFAAYDGESALESVVQLPDTDLLITNTRLGTSVRITILRRPLLVAVASLGPTHANFAGPDRGSAIERVGVRTSPEPG